MRTSHPCGQGPAVRQPAERIPWPAPADTELAWLAGLIDGEGTIALSIFRGRGSGGVKTVFSISNTNLENLGNARPILRALAGRDLIPRPEKRSRSEWRPAFVLRTEKHSDIKAILEAVRPWLVGKRKQAELMLAYLEQCSGAIRNAHGHDSPELRDLRHRFVAQMHELNYRYRRGEWRQRHPEEIDPMSIVPAPCDADKESGSRRDPTLA